MMDISLFNGAFCDWSTVRRLLCIRLDSIGDVLMTTPAIAALKEAFPLATLSLLTSAQGAAVGSLADGVDEVIRYAAPWMKASARTAGAEDHRFIMQLKAMQFDGAVIFTAFSQSPLPAAMMCYLADIPLRLAHCRENPYWLLTHWIKDPEPDAGIRHEVERQLELVAHIGCSSRQRPMSLRVSSAARAVVRKLLERLGVGFPWLVMHPGATAPSRRYPPEQFRKAAARLLDLGFAVVFTGGPEEIPLVQEIREPLPKGSHSLAGLLTLEELAALCAAAPLVITNNSGPAHIAAAVGTPVVDIYALTNPQHTPWAVRSVVLSHDVPCKNCFKSICPLGHNDCLAKIPPEDVVNAAISLLAPDAEQQEANADVYAWY